jgi:hypothetical protein
MGNKRPDPTESRLFLSTRVAQFRLPIAGWQGSYPSALLRCPDSPRDAFNDLDLGRTMPHLRTTPLHSTLTWCHGWQSKRTVYVTKCQYAAHELLHTLQYPSIPSPDLLDLIHDCCWTDCLHSKTQTPRMYSQLGCARRTSGIHVESGELWDSKEGDSRGKNRDWHSAIGRAFERGASCSLHPSTISSPTTPHDTPSDTRTRPQRHCL